MVATFSTVDLATRIEIQDRLSRFCHSLDHNQPEEWTSLFRSDAVVIAPRFGLFRGREEISKIPELVALNGEGAWRHVFSNSVIDVCDNYKNYHVRAYCTVSDWRKGGTAVRCWDFSAKLIRKRHLLISELEMRPVGEFAENPASRVSQGLVTAAMRMSEAIFDKVPDQQ